MSVAQLPRNINVSQGTGLIMLLVIVAVVLIFGFIVRRGMK
jgi:hypothetical protein